MNLFPDGPTIPKSYPLWRIVKVHPGDACRWTEDEDGNWDTNCGEAFYLSEGPPSVNKIRFCCYCGKPLEEVKK